METQVRLEQWKATKQSATYANQNIDYIRPERVAVDEESLHKRRERDLELAKTRKAQHDQQIAKRTEREKRLSEIGPSSKYQVVGSKLLSATKASEAMRVREEELDAAEHRRHSTGAHGSRIAGSGRDLQFGGKATPTWMKAVK